MSASLPSVTGPLIELNDGLHAEHRVHATALPMQAIHDDDSLHIAETLDDTIPWYQQAENLIPTHLLSDLRHLVKADMGDTCREEYALEVDIGLTSLTAFLTGDPVQYSTLVKLAAKVQRHLVIMALPEPYRDQLPACASSQDPPWHS
jgi:hypothetical protein